MSVLRLAGILLLALRFAAAETDPQRLLQQASAKVASSVEHMPRYTCLETVNREYFRSPGNAAPRSAKRSCASTIDAEPPPPTRWVWRDRLRLEVTMAERGEIFSWPGASRFEDGSIDRVVQSGPIGSGAFAGFLKTIFRGNGKHLKYLRQVSHEGRTLVEYSFEISAAESDYRVKYFLPKVEWRLTAYSGSVQIDAETGNVVQVTAQTAALPEAAGNCRTMTHIDFGKVNLAGREFLLPLRAWQRFVFAGGEETINTITFAGCREYRAETRLAFDNPDRDPGQAKPEKSQLRVLPAGLWFTMDLVTPIRSSAAAAGDPFTARLAEPLYENAAVLAPRGSTITGHLLRAEMDMVNAQVILVLKPETLETPGGTVRLNGSLRSREKHEVLLLLRDGEAGGGIFSFKGFNVEIRKGWRTTWRTVAP